MARAAVWGLALVALVGAGCSDGSERGYVPPGPLHARYVDAPEGRAFERPGEQGSNALMRPTGYLVVALVTLRNVTAEPVRVIGAEPVWSDVGFVARRFRLSPPGAGRAGTTRDQHHEGSIEFTEADPIEPSSPTEAPALVTFEVLLEPPAEVGVLLGVDVFYEQSEQVRWQRWPLVLLLCDWDTHPEGCESYNGTPVDRLDFEPLLAQAVSGAPP